jgi:hypothetical protein
MSGDGRWKRLWNSPWRTALLAGGGALAGVAYYQLIGCRAGGTCAITSSAWRTAAYFALVAAVVGFPGRPAAAGPTSGADTR